MSLESATFIDDLDSSNPTSTDSKSQGDDHLRLIKSVLKASIKRVSRAFYVPGFSASKTADFTVLSSDDNRTFLVDTTAGSVTATLPTLVSADAGWECSFVKTNTGTNPLFIAPASGTIQSGEVAGLSKTRRCVPGHKTRVFWTGSAWFAERVVKLPVGAIIDCPVSGLPVGYEWANGQTLSSSANYPDFNSANGGLTVQDRRGRTGFGRSDMGGSDSSRLTSATMTPDGVTLGANGGTERLVLLPGNMPNFNLPIGTLTVGGTVTLNNIPAFNYAKAGDPNPSPGGNNSLRADVSVPGATFAGTIGGSLNSGGSDTPIDKMPPAIITNFIVVVE